MTEPHQKSALQALVGALHAQRHWLHPILASLFPALLLYSTNVNSYGLDVLWRPCLISAALALAFAGLFSLWMGDARKACLITTLTVLACYSFGPVHTIAGPGAALIPVVYAMTLFAIGRVSKSLDAVTRIVTVSAFALVALPISTILLSSSPAPAIPLPPVATPTIPAAGPLPDIYFVILDGYGRSDVLRDLYGYDNSAFVDQLRQRGFYIAGDSRSNYPQTKLSLASTFNLEYLDTMLDGVDRTKLDHRVSRQLIANNRLARILKQHGYSILQVESPLYDAEIERADDTLRKWWFLNLFEISIADMTPFPWLLETGGLPGPHELHRRRMTYSFDAVDEIGSVRGPKFAFIHIFAGHPPFVFDEDDAPRNPPHRYSWKGGIDYLSLPGASKEEYRSAYKAQLEHVNHRVLPMLDKILAHSKTPPVIVVQGDHGPASNLNQYDAEATDMVEAFDILNAIHMGGAGDTALYPSISPVNTFRVILNAYLRTDFKLLNDRSYFSVWTRPYEFTAVEADRAHDAVR